MRLLIHADPGARSGFLACWLTDMLTDVKFDCGELNPSFRKIHYLNNPRELLSFKGTKIRIKPQLEYIDLISYLFLQKNVYPQIPEFTRDEYSLDTFTKLTRFANEVFQWDSELDYSLYDYVINFSDTYDKNSMVGLYKNVNDRTPSDLSLDMFDRTNKLNKIKLDPNHAASIMKLVIMREKELLLEEKNRCWSVVDVYHNTPTMDLSSVIYNKINPENYIK